MAAMVVVTFLMVLYCWMDEWFSVAFVPATGWSGLYEYVCLVPSIAYSIVVLYLDATYSKFASRLTQFENHRTENDVRNGSCFVLCI